MPTKTNTDANGGGRFGGAFESPNRIAKKPSRLYVLIHVQSSGHTLNAITTTTEL